MLLRPNCQLNLKITNNALPFTEQALTVAAHLSGSKNVVGSAVAAAAKEKKTGVSNQYPTHHLLAM